jgi:glutamine synthetase
MLVGSGVFTDKELESRVEVEYEKFAKKVQIESRVLGDLAINHIVPIAIKYMTSLIENVQGLKDIFSDTEFERLAGARKEVIVSISDHISSIKKLVNEMVDERRKANIIEDNYKKALAYESKVKPYLDEIRTHIDKLELVVDNEMWPLPKYRELLFTR